MALHGIQIKGRHSGAKPRTAPAVKRDPAPAPVRQGHKGRTPKITAAKLYGKG